MSWFGWDVLINLGAALPLILVGCVGILLSITRRRVNSKAALYVMLASIILILEAVGFRFLYRLPALLFSSRDLTPLQYQIIFTVLNFLDFLVTALAFALLLAAAFTGRNSRTDSSEKVNI